MDKRISDKINQIENFLSDLIKYRPDSLEDYEQKNDKKAICERYLEKIIEAMVDLAFLVVKEKRLDIPDSDMAAFDILEKNKVINSNLADRLKEARGMRNILIHQYGEIDDTIVFEVVHNEIEKDAEEFLENVKKSFN